SNARVKANVPNDGGLIATSAAPVKRVGSPTRTPPECGSPKGGRAGSREPSCTGGTTCWGLRLANIVSAPKVPHATSGTNRPIGSLSPRRQLVPQFRPFAFDHCSHFIRNVVGCAGYRACEGALGPPASCPGRRQCEAYRHGASWSFPPPAFCKCRH